MRNEIFIPATNFFPFIFERQCETQLRSNTVTVRPDVSHNANRLALADDIKNPVDNFGVTFHRSIFIVSRRGFFQFPDDLQYAIAAYNGIVKNEFQSWRVF